MLSVNEAQMPSLLDVVHAVHVITEDQKDYGYP